MHLKTRFMILKLTVYINLIANFAFRLDGKQDEVDGATVSSSGSATGETVPTGKAAQTTQNAGKSYGHVDDCCLTMHGQSLFFHLLLLLAISNSRDSMKRDRCLPTLACFRVPSPLA